MSSFEATEIVKLSIKLTNYLNLINLHFSKSKFLVVQSNIKTRGEICWQILFALSVSYSFLEFFYSLSKSKPVNFFNLFFHGFQLITKVTVVGYYLAFNNEFRDIALLLNNILWHNRKKKDLLFFSILSSCFSCIIKLYIVVLPMTSLMFPCVHQIPHVLLSAGSCTRWSYRFAMLLFSFLCQVPNGLLGALVVSTCFVLLRELLHQFQQLRHYMSHRQRENMPVMYRKLQLFIKLCNNSFQTHVWPSYEFVGTAIIMSTVYSIIVFEHKLKPIAILLLVSCALLTLVVVCGTLEMASNPLKYSKRFLEKSRSFKWSAQSTKFFSSCPYLAFKIGTFHEIDRDRVPTFCRFILQRTFFLVAKSRKEDAVSGLVLLLPGE